MSYVAVCDNGDLNGTPFPSGTDNAQYNSQKEAEKHEANNPGHHAYVTSVYDDDDV